MRRKRLIKKTRNNSNNSKINRTTRNRKQKLEEKQLHRYFKRRASEIIHEKTFIWLGKRTLVRVSESLLTGVQINVKKDKLCFSKNRLDATK